MPLKFAAGVKVQVVASVCTSVPCVVVTLVMLRFALSTSVTLASRSDARITKMPSSCILYVTTEATGASLTGAIVMLIACGTAIEPSEIVALRLTVPLKLAAGLKVQVPFPLFTKVPCVDVILVTLSNCPSTSETFANKSDSLITNVPSSSILYATGRVTGRSFTGATLITAVLLIFDWPSFILKFNAAGPL